MSSPVSQFADEKKHHHHRRSPRVPKVQVIAPAVAVAIAEVIASTRSIARGPPRSGFNIAEGRVKPAYYDWQLSNAVDLTRPLEIAQVPIFDERHLNTSNADAVCFLYQYAALTQKLAFCDVSPDVVANPSRLFVNYNSKLVGLPTIEGCLRGINQFGMTIDALWSYDKKHAHSRPHESAYAYASKFGSRKILFEKIPANDVDKVRQAKSSINNGQPLATCFAIYRSFNRDLSGLINLPTHHELEHSAHHHHALVLVGYNDFTQTFLARNNKGKLWGDRGYCHIPYAYVASGNLCGDMWTLMSNSLDLVAERSYQVEGTIPNQIPRWVNSLESVEQLNNSNYTPFSNRGE